jgi:dihydroflavonol-4-reductase
MANCAKMTIDLEKPALVTGATGMVGNNLVRHLLELGRTVRVLVRQENKNSLAGLEVETYIGDVLQPETMQAAMKGVSTVFHLAGAISIDGQHDSHMRRVNIEGTANVAVACRNAGVERMVHFSSIHALTYHPKDLPIDESRDLALGQREHLAYDLSKAEAERRVLIEIQFGLDAVILNPVGIIGPFDFEPSPAGEFLQQLIHRQLPGLVKAGYFWVDVRDVARAAVAAESNGRCGERYILYSQYATFKSIAGWVQEISGARPPRLVLPIWVAKIFAPAVVWYSRLRGIRPLVTPESIQIICCHQNIATEKAAKELGFQPRSIRETVIDTVSWLQDRESNKSNQRGTN